VQTKEARNKDDNYHHADDIENVHCVLKGHLRPSAEMELPIGDDDRPRRAAAGCPDRDRGCTRPYQRLPGVH
jgi:hypothetical protein